MEKQLLIDDIDLRKISEIKDKFIKLKLYGEAAECRHVEKMIMHHIHEQQERQKRKEKAKYAVDFATYLLTHFVPTQGEIKGEKFLGYVKRGDTSEQPKAYTPSDVHDFYIEFLAAQEFENRTGWSVNDPSHLSKIERPVIGNPDSPIS